MFGVCVRDTSFLEVSQHLRNADDSPLLWPKVYLCVVDILMSPSYKEEVSPSLDLGHQHLLPIGK